MTFASDGRLANIEEAFQHTNIKTIIIPASVEVIGSKAFYMSALESVEWVEGVLCQISDGAFRFTNLTS